MQLIPFPQSHGLYNLWWALFHLNDILCFGQSLLEAHIILLTSHSSAFLWCNKREGMKEGRKRSLSMTAVLNGQMTSNQNASIIRSPQSSMAFQSITRKLHADCVSLSWKEHVSDNDNATKLKFSVVWRYCIWLKMLTGERWHNGAMGVSHNLTRAFVLNEPDLYTGLIKSQKTPGKKNHIYWTAV